MPDWEGIRPVEVGGITDGAVTEFRMKIGIVPQRWVAKHHSYIEGEQFCDDSIKGPFARWNHVHKFVDVGDQEMTIEDKVDWKLPFHFFSRIGAPIMVMPRVRTMFKHRTRRILADLTRQEMFKDQPRRRILISGSTGLIGTQLGAFPKQMDMMSTDSCFHQQRCMLIKTQTRSFDGTTKQERLSRVLWKGLML
jgi:ligand-binding SRPBCC domain-containing protein